MNIAHLIIQMIDQMNEWLNLIIQMNDQFQIKWMTLEVCTRRFTKIGKYCLHKIQHCSVHMNKKKKFNTNSSNLEVLDDLDYGIDELGVFKSWTKLLRINSANYEGFGFIYKSHFIAFSCYHNSLQGHQLVINDAAKEFSMMLRLEWSNEHWRCAQNGSRKLADTDTTKFSAAVFISIIWTRNRQFLKSWSIG